MVRTLCDQATSLPQDQQIETRQLLAQDVVGSLATGEPLLGKAGIPEAAGILEGNGGRRLAGSRTNSSSPRQNQPKLISAERSLVPALIAGTRWGAAMKSNWPLAKPNRPATDSDWAISQASTAPRGTVSAERTFHQHTANGHAGRGIRREGAGNAPTAPITG
jgi:hypothetical protein